MMIVNTCIKNRSEFGYSSSILKSGVCKYFRRGEREKFKWCVMEMAKFNDIADGNQAAKAIVTNLLNRLKILLMEELSCLEVDKIYNGICLLRNYDANRNDKELLLRFCDNVCESKRNRATSYVNNWWRNKDMDVKKMEIARVEKYRKKGDSDELLVLGENLIEYIEKKDEKMFGIFMKMVALKGKNGLRYRRRDGDYLWWEIMDSYIDDEIVKQIWIFALDRYMVKGMKERYYFGIWIGLMVWKGSAHGGSVHGGSVHGGSAHGGSVNEGSAHGGSVHGGSVYGGSGKKYDVDKYYKHMKYLKMDDYVVNDFHVNKKFGLEDFAVHGAFVKDEDLNILGENGKKYKDYYIEIKKSMDEEKRLS
jgi:hypothetical protein